MKIRVKLSLAIVFIISLAVIGYASNPVDAAATALSNKIKKDLAMEEVNLKLSKVQTHRLSNSLVVLKGNGTVNEQEISFNVKLKSAKLIPTQVEYEFIDPNLSDPFSEESLTNDLLQKIHNDLKKENIVIAVDYFDIQPAENHKKVITGEGDLRVGMDWKRVKFEMVKPEKNYEPIIKYRIY